MSDSDAQLELKKRARRRLVGAIALFLAAAIILPMVMDSEPKPTGNELQIRIPSQEGGNYASRLIVGALPTPVATSPSEPLSELPSASAPLEQSMPASSAPVVVPEVATQPSPVIPAPTPVKPDVAETKPPSPTAEIKPSKADDGARAKAILEGQSAAVASPQKFYVQLGAYRDTSNVKSLQTRLKAAGFASTTEKVGQKTRVRVGPFVNRPAAERALVKLKKLGLSGVVTAK